MQFSTKFALRTLAILIFVGTLALWLGTGAHTGWTQTRVEQREYDEITDIEYTVWKDQFVAGIEILAAGAFVSLSLTAISFIPTINSKQNQ